MGDIWSTDKLTLFIAFVIPGFISLQMYRLFVAGDDSDLVKKLPAIISCSALHYLVFGWILLISTGNWLEAWTYAVVLVFPTIWPFIVLLFRDYEKWSRCFCPRSTLFREMLKPEATPWDRVFGRKQFVRITLKDGRFVGGYLADGSAVSMYPNDGQIISRTSMSSIRKPVRLVSRFPRRAFWSMEAKSRHVDLVAQEARWSDEVYRTHGLPLSHKPRVLQPSLRFIPGMRSATASLRPKKRCSW